MELKQLIQATYTKYDGKYGYRQIQLFLLQDYGVWVNHKKVLRLMQMMNLRSCIRRKQRCNYVSSVGGRVAENLLQRQFYADKPNKKWVTDVTQYRVGERLGYTFQLSKIYSIYDIRNLDDARRRIVEYIHFYNQNRLQRKLKKLTPVEYRRQLAA